MYGVKPQICASAFNPVVVKQVSMMRSGDSVAKFASQESNAAGSNKIMAANGPPATTEFSKYMFSSDNMTASNKALMGNKKKRL